MEKILSFFKRRWWSFVPLLVCVCIFFLFWKFNEYDNGDNLLQIIGGFILFSFPSTIPILFVRRQLFNLWSFVVIPLFVVSAVFLSTIDNSPTWFGPTSRGLDIIVFGFSFSVITLLWSIIHTLILRHREKKMKQTIAK